MWTSAWPRHGPAVSRPHERAEARNRLTRIRARSCGRTPSGRPATASPIGGLLEQWSATATGRSSRRHDWEFSREESVVEWRAWNWTEIQAPTTSPGSPWRSSCRTHIRTRRITSDKGSPDTCRRDIRIGDCKSDPRFATPRCHLLAYSGTRRSTFPFVQVFKSSPALRATHQGGVQAQRDRRSAVLPVQEPDAHGFGGSYRPSEIPCR